MLHINDLTYRVQGAPLLEKATLAIYKGERVGLVGRNGSGKTTLIRMIAGSLQPDAGSISLARGVRVGWLAQEAPGGPETLIEFVLAADEERVALLKELEDNPASARLAELHERLTTIEAASAPARAARILAGLGFDEEAQNKPCAVYSGGWRMRVALAALLFSNPDLLLLDEPSNHLDLEASMWLENYLKSYRGTFVIISHDRGLLNRAVTRIIHLSARKLTAYGGNYDRFERTRLAQQKTQSALYAQQQIQRKHIESFINRFRAQANKARQAQSRIKALERMEPIAQITSEATISFDFPTPVPLSPPIITLDGAAVGYGDAPPVLGGLDLRLDMDDRIGLLGANGNGKSTLARLLAGRLKPVAGRMTRSPKLVVGYFSQDQAEMLDLSATPLAQLARLMPKEPETRLRAQLGRFGFGADRAEVEIGKLSGGEKARLLFALVSREKPHLLILDEPTNHLDMDSRQALVEAIGGYEGAVVLVSHDPHLMELVADRLWLVNEGGVKPFDGDLEDYRKHLIEVRRRARGENGPKGERLSAGPSRKEIRQNAAQKRQENAALRKAVQAAEKRVSRLSEKLSLIEAELASPALYDASTAKLMGVQLKHSEVKLELQQAEESWFEIQEKLETSASA